MMGRFDGSIAFLQYQEEFLLFKRQPEQFGGNQWGLVGGAREEGESALETLRRELIEEIQYDIEGCQVKRHDVVSVPGPSRELAMAVFTVYLPEKIVLSPTAEEYAAYAWTSYDGLDTFDLMPGLVVVLEYLGLR